ncbi:MAG: helix-turn-helix transcriptional regulator [Ruminococcaceae bacterium]|nr:helix-turn-helix transcriptional regulator [Oscillospiraceae bacterium]
MTLGERIKALRLGRGMSQEGLADALDVTRQAVSKWETDGSVPDIDKLIGLCELFSVSMDYLVRGREETQTDEGIPEKETQFSQPPGRTVLDYVIIRKICGALCMIQGIRHMQGFLMHLYILILSDSFSIKGGGYWGWLACPLYLIAGFSLFFWDKRKQIRQRIRQIPHKLLWTGWAILGIGSLAWYIEWEEEIDVAIRFLQFEGRYPENIYHRYLEDLRIVYPGTGILLLMAVGMACWTVYTFRRKTMCEHRSHCLKRNIALETGIVGLLGCAVTVLCCKPGHDLPPLLLFAGLYMGFWLGLVGITVYLSVLPARMTGTDA